MNNFESGNHVNLPGVEMIPVRAFRLEPQATRAKGEKQNLCKSLLLDESQKRPFPLLADGTPSRKGFLTVDGELVDYGPLQAEVLPSFVNIVA